MRKSPPLEKFVLLFPMPFSWVQTTSISRSRVAGTVSWVIPTALAVIALERSRWLNLVSPNELKRRVNLGHTMRLDRMCPGGGWNAGNSIVYGAALAAAY